MQLAFILFSFLSPALANAATSDACATRHVVNCESLATTPMNAAGSKTLGFPASRDGTVYYNPLGAYSRDGTLSDEGTARLATLGDASPAQVKRALDTSNDVKRMMMDFIRGDVRDDALTTEERTERDQLISRIDKLQIRMAENSEPMCDGEVQAGSPTAGYLAQSHTVYICPAAARTDVQSLVRTIAHEIGHVVQECSSTRPMFEVVKDRGSYQDFRDCSEDLIDSSGGEGMGFIKDKYLRRIADGNVTHVVESADESAIRDLVRCGILKPVQNSAVREPRLMRETEQCIQRGNRANYTKMLEVYVDSDVEHDPTLTRATARERVQTWFKESCQNRMGEHYSDSFASAFLGHYAGVKRWKASDVKASTLLFSGMSCIDFESYNTMAYPPWSDRTQVLLNSPALANLLGCSVSRPDTNLCPLVLTTRTDSRAAGTAPARQSPRPTKGSR